MRENIFRGKPVTITAKNGWCTGNLIVQKNGRVYIEEQGGKHIRREVIPETVGQFTGLYDSKRTKRYPAGQPVFEGDLLRRGARTFVAEYRDGCFEACEWFDSKDGGYYIRNALICETDRSEVIGNKYDA